MTNTEQEDMRFGGQEVPSTSTPVDTVIGELDRASGDPEKLAELINEIEVGIATGGGRLGVSYEDLLRGITTWRRQRKEVQSLRSVYEELLLEQSSSNRAKLLQGPAVRRGLKELEKREGPGRN